MITKYQLKIQSVNKKALTLYLTSLQTFLKKVNLLYSFVHLPVRKKRITLLKSPHVNKSAREQFEIKNYKTIITFFNLPNSAKIVKLLTINKPKVIVLSIKNL
jgi:ribosomal protein S10